uniref:Integrase catalytic domain-containing protein n=1 Tax=Strongyloides venezuelensis TaxID=75913 RepID=A0A0K0FSE6_STRVS
MNKKKPGRLIETHKKFLPHLNEIWTVLNADFMQVDNEHILVLIDEYSKFVVTSVCKKQNGPTLKLILMKCFTRLGCPKILQSDNGPAFIAQPVTVYLSSVNVEQQFSSSHHHTSNAVVEKFNHTLRASIRIHIGESLAADKRDQFYKPDLKRHGHKFKEGDLVLRKIMHRKDAATSAKNQPQWEDPFTVVKRLYGDTYKIERLENHRRTRLSVEKIHADRLKKYAS